MLEACKDIHGRHNLYDSTDKGPCYKIIRPNLLHSCSFSRYLAGVWCFNSIREIVGTLCFTACGCDKSTIYVFHNANSGRLPTQLLAIEAAAVQPLL